MTFFIIAAIEALFDGPAATLASTRADFLRFLTAFMPLRLLALLPLFRFYRALLMIVSSFFSRFQIFFPIIRSLPIEWPSQTLVNACLLLPRFSSLCLHSSLAPIASPPFSRSVFRRFRIAFMFCLLFHFPPAIFAAHAISSFIIRNSCFSYFMDLRRHSRRDCHGHMLMPP